MIGCHIFYLQSIFHLFFYISYEFYVLKNDILDNPIMTGIHLSVIHYIS
jgi:hypothetical protein